MLLRDRHVRPNEVVEEEQSGLTRAVLRNCWRDPAERLGIDFRDHLLHRLRMGHRDSLVGGGSGSSGVPCTNSAHSTCVQIAPHLGAVQTTISGGRATKWSQRALSKIGAFVSVKALRSRRVELPDRISREIRHRQLRLRVRCHQPLRCGCGASAAVADGAAPDTDSVSRTAGVSGSSAIASRTSSLR